MLSSGDSRSTFNLGRPSCRSREKKSAIDYCKNACSVSWQARNIFTVIRLNRSVVWTLNRGPSCSHWSELARRARRMTCGVRQTRDDTSHAKGARDEPHGEWNDIRPDTMRSRFSI